MNKVEILENGNVKITIPMSFRSCAGRKRIVTPDSETSFTDPMITNIARAFRWQTLIDEGKFSNVHELARAIGKDDAYVSRIIRFTLLALEIVFRILAGSLRLLIKQYGMSGNAFDLCSESTILFNTWDTLFKVK